MLFFFSFGALVKLEYGSLDELYEVADNYLNRTNTDLPMGHALWTNRQRARRDLIIWMYQWSMTFFGEHSVTEGHRSILVYSALHCAKDMGKLHRLSKIH